MKAKRQIRVVYSNMMAELRQLLLSKPIQIDRDVWLEPSEVKLSWWTYRNHKTYALCIKKSDGTVYHIPEGWPYPPEGIAERLSDYGIQVE
jgi:hypothetical protein